MDRHSQVVFPGKTVQNLVMGVCTREITGDSRNRGRLSYYRVRVSVVRRKRKPSNRAHWLKVLRNLLTFGPLKAAVIFPR